MTRKWNIINDLSNADFSVGNEIIYNTEVLKSNFCDYIDACILLRGDVTVKAAPATQVSFKKCGIFTKCITKTVTTTIDDTEDLDLVMPMYNLIQYSSDYSETTRSLWFYLKDEGTNFNVDIANDNDFKSFKYKAKLLRNTEADVANGILKNATIAVPLKYLSNFWKSVGMPLINCKIELKCKWTKYYVLPAAGNDNVNSNDNDNKFVFTIKETKLFVPVVTLSARENQKLSKLLSKGLERSVY